VEVIDRDSFDQDKEYRAHKSKVVKKLDFDISEKMEWIEVSNSDVLESEDFPGNVRFRDFKIIINKSDLLDNELKFSVNQSCSKD
jgi:hypothetical protein